jgi:hypothetical protein
VPVELIDGDAKLVLEDAPAEVDDAVDGDTLDLTGSGAPSTAP